ncbi:hypothetical protein Cgig2_024108 [Carnegiea gigantea]|uniref:Late embryogenesis abundant protein LEA-2 subgroup domain-containing protein n=1 Tax=Carnegiea gigantea TaxID=171969 RepID=A0A9Q1JK00_9CARY|nr:hypothetical protein Cgig2_024108 [Carnegiea gigantea]
MEERVPPRPAATTIHHQDLEDTDSRFRHRHRDHEYCTNNHDGQTTQIVSNSNDNNYNTNYGRPVQTYIVQIPKDQIYRVPPPEHAKIVERYRNPATNRGRSRCMCWCLSVFFTLAFIIMVISCVARFTLSPKPPTFSVKHLVVKHPEKLGPPGFQITVETDNPNSNNDIEYGTGTATLCHKDKEVAKGGFPPLDNVGPGKVGSMDVVLEGSRKAELPEKPKSPLTLDLEMSIPAKMKTWLFTKKKDMNIECEFEVNSLGDNVKL